MTPREGEPSTHLPTSSELGIRAVPCLQGGSAQHSTFRTSKQGCRTRRCSGTEHGPIGISAHSHSNTGRWCSSAAAGTEQAGGGVLFQGHEQEDAPWSRKGELNLYWVGSVPQAMAAVGCITAGSQQQGSHPQVLSVGPGYVDPRGDSPPFSFFDCSQWDEQVKDGHSPSAEALPGGRRRKKCIPGAI